MSNLNYAGIGSRMTPNPILLAMVSVAQFLADEQYTLRSGGAEGADTAFERGCDQNQGKKEIYLPWKRFRGNSSPLYMVSDEALDLATRFHPAWGRLGNTGQNFMARNAYQILGQNLDTPADLLICWTPAGKVTGGTGQALRMANHFSIPVINLGAMELDDAETKMENFLSEKENHNA